jgi:hypothetical protein
VRGAWEPVLRWPASSHSRLILIEQKDFGEDVRIFKNFVMLMETGHHEYGLGSFKLIFTSLMAGCGTESLWGDRGSKN